MPSATPRPPVPVFLDGTTVQQGDLALVTQRDLNALVEHARQLFAWQMGGHRTRKPLAKVRSTTGIVPSNSPTFIVWDVVELDTDNLIGPDPTAALQVRTPGFYLVEAQGRVGPVAGATNATPVLASRILVNGTVQETDAVAVKYARFSPTVGATARCMTLVALNAGATVRALLEHNAGVTANQANTDGGTSLDIEWFAPLAPDEGGMV